MESSNLSRAARILEATYRADIEDENTFWTVELYTVVSKKFILSPDLPTPSIRAVGDVLDEYGLEQYRENLVEVRMLVNPEHDDFFTFALYFRREDQALAAARACCEAEITYLSPTPGSMLMVTMRECRGTRDRFSLVGFTQVIREVGSENYRTRTIRRPWGGLFKIAEH